MEQKNKLTDPSKCIHCHLCQKHCSFLKKYEMIIGLGVFGIGVLSLLIAIITKTKKSKIM